MFFKNLEGQLAWWLEHFNNMTLKLFIEKEIYIVMLMTCSDDLVQKIIVIIAINWIKKGEIIGRFTFNSERLDQTDRLETGTEE